MSSDIQTSGQSEQQTGTSTGFAASARADSSWGRHNTAAVSIAASMAFEHISHDFGSGPALDDVSLTIEPGKVTCLLGPSGSGKTTLLRIAAGIERQTSGVVSLNSSEVAGPNIFVPPEKRGIGMVFQDYALFPHMSILDNVRFGLRGMASAEKTEQAMRLLARVGLETMAQDYPHALSGGEQQRVALARALAPRPGILLLDEPFSGLDSRLRDTVRGETLSVLRETRATSIVVTHDPAEALMMSDQIALLRRGRLAQLGPGQELYDHPQNQFVARFFSPVNSWQGRVQDFEVDTPLGVVEAPGFHNGTKVTVCVRQSALNLSKRTGSGKRARISFCRFMGDYDLLSLAVEGLDNPVIVKHPAGQLSEKAMTGREDVYVSPSMAGTFVFPADATD
ncbi:MAG: ABC transporter ATP-binding protein [Pseudomonadota bacterium]